MARSRVKSKGRRDKRSFIQIPHVILKCDAYAKLGAGAVKLLLDLFGQFKGYNNGDFAMAWSMMSLCGWHSKDTLYRARDQLIENGFIVQTRQGGKHQCSLYAVTWLAIDECSGKLDCQSTKAPLGYWKQGMVPKLESVPRIQTTLAR